MGGVKKYDENILHVLQKNNRRRQPKHSPGMHRMREREPADTGIQRSINVKKGKVRK